MKEVKQQCVRKPCRNVVEYRVKVLCNGKPQYVYSCQKHAADMGYRAFDQPFERIKTEEFYG